MVTLMSQPMRPPLPRRISLGIALPSFGAFTPEGMRIAAVVRGSMADAAGLAPGDVVSAVDGVPLRSFEALRDVTRRAAELETLSIAAARHGELFETTMRVVPRPVESVGGA